jgi:hypothetical protein
MKYGAARVVGALEYLTTLLPFNFQTLSFCLSYSIRISTHGFSKFLCRQHLIFH